MNKSSGDQIGIKGLQQSKENIWGKYSEWVGCSEYNEHKFVQNVAKENIY